MRILACDPSLQSFGWAAGPAALGDYGVLVPPGTGRKNPMVGVERLRWLRDEVVAMCEGRSHVLHGSYADIVVIEGASFGSKGSSFLDLAELRGVIRVAIAELGIPLVEVSPSTLKKYATGKGVADKPAMIAAAIRRLGYTGSDGNVADALWLWQLAAAQYGLDGVVAVPQSHREPTKKAKPIQWPVLSAFAHARREGESTAERWRIERHARAQSNATDARRV